jgi:ABC-type thiamine transport system ATPase subunit
MSAYHKIKRLEVKGGFLDGVDIDFVDNLNCIIGGRGTGKTTVIEFIRYALMMMPDERLARDQYKQIENLVLNNLGSGRIRLQLQTRDGFTYFVDRSANDEPEVLDENDEPTAVTLDRGVFKAEIYSQNQIEDIANSPYFQLELIDKFVEKEIGDTSAGIRSIIRELSHNASEIIRLKGEIADGSEGLTELDVVAEKIKALKIPEGEDAELIDKELTKKNLRDKETRTLDRANEFLLWVQATLQTFLDESDGRAKQVIDNDVLKGPNKELMRQSKTAISEFSASARNGIVRVQGSLVSCQGAIKKIEEELQKVHLEQEQKYRKVIEKHDEQKGVAKERANLQKKQNELLERKKVVEGKKGLLSEKQKQRERLLERLSELRDSRFELRQKVAEELNRKLMPEIKVSVTQFGNRDIYREGLINSMRGTGRWYTPLADRIISIPPQEFVRMIQSNSAQELIDHLNIDEERANWLISKLKDTNDIYGVETVELHDKPKIELKDGVEYKDSTELSTGQKCTTVLPILLLESESPLLVDQPEDNLDNKFIYDTVVRKIREEQNTRQLIFVTHNPNIPVLGDIDNKGRVFVMNSTGRKASIQTRGTVDEVKDDIETLLEGGREAFERRKERYGH